MGALRVDGDQRFRCVAEGNGPVDALAQALGFALQPHYPQLADVHLVDFKVRVVNSNDGTAAKVRVLIEHRSNHRRFATIGVSENIIEACWLALVEGCTYGYFNGGRPAEWAIEVISEADWESRFTSIPLLDWGVCSSF